MKRTLRLVVAALSMLMIAGTSQALNIALTNDDGWDAHGVQTLFDALVADGHTVTLVGSTENQSGTAAAIDLVGFGALVVTKELDGGDNDQYSANDTVAGDGVFPATAGQISIDIASEFGDVDLLISGTNAGANIGAFTTLSGTVGAALHGISYVSGLRVPSIAISTDEPQPLRNCGADPGNPTLAEEAICEAANIAQFEIVAAYMVEFVAALETQPGELGNEDGLLPDGVALNINHPIGAILGTKLAVQGVLPSLGGFPIGLPIGTFGCLTAEAGSCTNVAVGVQFAAGITGTPFISGADERKNADTEAYNAGFVSIVPFVNDITARGSSFAVFHALVNGL